MIYPNGYSGIIAAAVWSMAACAVAFRVWLIPRGLDITDESFLLLNYLDADTYVSSALTFHLIVAKLLAPFPSHIFTFRIARILMAVGSSALFAYGFSRFLKSHYRGNGFANVRFVLPMLTIVGLSTIGSGFPTISYNTINQSVLLVAAAFLFLSLSNIQSRSSFTIYPLIVGAISAFLLFIKFPSALVLLSIALIFFAFYPQISKRNILISITSIGLGFIVCLTLILNWLHTPDEWIQIYANITTLMDSTHDPYAIFWRYIKAGTILTGTFALVFSVPIAIYGWMLHRELNYSNTFRFSSIGKVVLLTYTIVALYIFEVFEIPIFNSARSLWVYFLAAVPPVFVIVFTFRGRVANVEFRDISLSWCVALFFLVVFPFIGSVGTRDFIFLNVLGHSEFVFGALLLLTLEANRQVPIKMAGSAALFVSMLFGTSQTIYAQIERPYNLAKGIASQVVPLEEPNFLAGLRVDAPTAEFFTKVRLSIRTTGFLAGDPILALYDLPGIVLITEGTSPGEASFWKGGSRRICRALQTKESLADDPLRIVVTDEPPDEDSMDCLKTSGIELEKDFRLLTKIENPYYWGTFGWHNANINIYVRQN